MKQNLSSDEIYLSDFLQILWKNKFIIISFVIFSVLAMYTFQYDKNPKKITAKTEIINISLQMSLTTSHMKAIILSGKTTESIESF